MSQVFGYICSDDSLTSEVMKQYGQPLRAVTPDERVGLGIGLLQDGRSLLRKHPKRKAASVDLPALLGDISSRSMVGHVRHEDAGTVGTKDLQPFRFRDWVYAQHGNEEKLKGAYDGLRASVPDHVRRNIEGNSMAELLFHSFYTRVESELPTTPRANWPQMYAQQLARTMVQVQQELNGSAGEDIAPLQAVAVTDRCIVAARIGEPMHYRLIEGIEEPTEEPLFAGHNPKSIKHDRFRALMVANEIDDEEWTEIPNHHVMWVVNGWDVEVAEIDELV